MTEKEIKEILKSTNNHIKISIIDGEKEIIYSSPFVHALEKAIEALDELREYKKLGTVEEYEAALEYTFKYYGMMKNFEFNSDGQYISIDRNIEDILTPIKRKIKEDTIDEVINTIKETNPEYVKNKEFYEQLDKISQAIKVSLPENNIEKEDENFDLD